MPKKDNSAGNFRAKLRLRREALAQLGDREPYVLETHGGTGRMGRILYGRRGVLLEKDEQKCQAVARARPGWPVYCGDSARMLADGLFAGEPFNFVDLDPYGDPWPVFHAFLSECRPPEEGVVLAFNDGLRRGLKLGTGWRYGSMAEATIHFGFDALYPRYLEIAKWIVVQAASKAGLRVQKFAGFYAGHAAQMAHYFAHLRRG